MRRRLHRHAGEEARIDERIAKPSANVERTEFIRGVFQSFMPRQSLELMYMSKSIDNCKTYSPEAHCVFD